MSRASIFGWSLPPGVTTLPDEEPSCCAVCGLDADGPCTCPPCPQCGEYGNPHCYIDIADPNHGMNFTKPQLYHRSDMIIAQHQEAIQEEHAYRDWLADQTACEHCEHLIENCTCSHSEVKSNV